MRAKQADLTCPDLSEFPSFSRSGSITGMKTYYLR